MYIAVLGLISIVNLVWMGDAQSICKFSAHVFEGFDESRRQGTDLMNGFITVRFTMEVKFRVGGTVEEETASMQVSGPGGVCLTARSHLFTSCSCFASCLP